MGFWSKVGELAVKGIEKANEKLDDYNGSYDKYSERYSNMSDERLKKEIQRLKSSTGGDKFERMGRIQAMKDELENRRG